MSLVDLVEEKHLKKDIEPFNVGDSVKVHVIIREGDKERVQAFGGICIGRRGRGVNETFTVRKVSYGEGVERTFPLYSPNVTKIEIVKTREKNKLAPRAKMHYLKQKGQ